MRDKEKEKALLEVCKKYTTDAPESIIFTEPYLPYIPEKWNGILVLAESQVIRSKDEEYAVWLAQLTCEERMTRIGRKEPRHSYEDGPDKIGVGPWDNGTIKLALKAIFIGANLELRLEDIAISNAVPWTRKTTGTNLNPDKQMQNKAAEFWEKTLDIWEPDIKAMVVLGNVAERVMTRKGISGKYTKNWLKLRLPPPNAINRVSGMFACDDLKERFPEVQQALDALKMSEEIEQYKMKVFFACHAVSLGLDKFKRWFGENKSE